MDGQKRQPHLQMLIIKKPVDQAKSLSFASANVVAEGHNSKARFSEVFAPEDRQHHRGDKSDPDLGSPKRERAAKTLSQPAPGHSPRLCRPRTAEITACALSD